MTGQTQAAKKLAELQNFAAEPQYIPGPDDEPFGDEGTLDATHEHSEATCVAWTTVVLPGERGEDGHTPYAAWNITLRQGITRGDFTALLEAILGSQEQLASYGGRFVTAQKLYDVSTVEVPVSNSSVDVATVPVQTPMAIGHPGNVAVGVSAGNSAIGIAAAAPAQDMSPIIFPIAWLDILYSDAKKANYTRLGGPTQPNGVYVHWSVLNSAFQVNKSAELGRYPVPEGFEAIAERDKQKPQFPGKVVAIRKIGDASGG